MTTALITKEQFVSLAAGGDAREAMTAMAQSGESFTARDLIRIKTPAGGGTVWMVPGPTGEEPRREITGALVHYQKCGVLWPSDEMMQGQMPVLRTFDMLIGEQVGPIPDDMREILEPYRISGSTMYHVSESSGFPYSQWGTGKNGVGKRLKEQRQLFILPRDALAPYLIVVQPGSLRAVTTWFKQGPQVTRVPWFRWEVRLTLERKQNETGQAFASIKPEVIGILDAETSEMLQRTWGDLLKRVSREVAAEQE